MNQKSRNEKHVDISILSILEETQKFGVLDLSKLEKGNQIHVTTKNSIYKMEIVGNKMVVVQGGKRYLQPTKVRFNGSTWGTSMLWMNRIGYKMRMEFYEPETRATLTTSSVKAAKIFGENWSYQMEW